MKIPAVKGLLAAVAAVASFGALTASAAATFVSVNALQRYPWNGLVDITVVFEGSAEDVAATECEFIATNKTTKAELIVASIVQEVADTGSGSTWTRKYVWNAAADVGKIRIGEVALTARTVESVQLWANGPFWATSNIGATKPEEAGWYFRWGDKVGYKRNAANTGWVSTDGKGTAFSFGDGSLPTMNKTPAELQTAGYTDASNNLVPEYDAARQTLRLAWRMPSSADFSALANNCTSTWTNDYNGVAGRIFKGKGTYASRSIFLPAAGQASGSGRSDWNTKATYWSATPASGNSVSSYFLLFDWNVTPSQSNDRRGYGRPIRAVRTLVK